MSSQSFTATQREAIWLAYDRKCAYTKQLLDISNFHIDHILPESLAKDPLELSKVLSNLGRGYTIIRVLLRNPRNYGIWGHPYRYAHVERKEVQHGDAR